MAVFVISVNLTLIRFFSGILRHSAVCQAMLSPSLSSSVAKYVLSHSLYAFLNSATTFFFDCKIEYMGSYCSSSLIDNCFDSKSLICPTVAFTK